MRYLAAECGGASLIDDPHFNASPLQPTRILHVISTVDPAAGGPSESVRVLLSFSDTGYLGEVVTLDAPDAPFLAALPFKVHALGPRRAKYGFEPQLYRWLKQNGDRFDGVVVNGLWQFGGVAALLALSRRIPYVVFSHGMLDPYFKQAFPAKHMKKWIYWAAAEFWVLRHAYRVLFTTAAEARLAEQSFWLHQWKGFVVPYGCARPPSNPTALVEAFLEHLPELRDQRFLLFLGRIHRKKGCDLLIDSFLRLAARDPGLHLVIAGPDEQGWSTDLKQRVQRAGLEDRIHWPGMLRGDAKWGAFYASEAFILPSHQENFGIAVAEALACGKPALLTDKVNIAPEIAADGAGLMEPDTQQGTDNLLNRWMATLPEERENMGRQAFACFEQRYDMRNNAIAIMRLFQQAHRERNTKTNSKMV